MNSILDELTSQSVPLKERAELLETSGWCRGIEWNDLLLLAKYFAVVTLPPGTEVIREGVAHRYLGVVLKGSLAVRKEDSSGSPHTLAQLKAGRLFGEISFLDGAPPSASVQSVEPTTVAFVSKESFERLEHEQPAIALGVWRRIAVPLCQRLRQTSGKLVELL